MSEPAGASSVFLSCVSREFHGPTQAGAPVWDGSYRTALSRALDECGLHVVVQERFAQTGGDLLSKLDAFIERCSAGVHLVGRAAGATPADDEVAGLLRRHPKFLESRRTLRDELAKTDFKGISYTQWEALLAIHHGRPLLVFMADGHGVTRHPDFAVQPGDEASQARHRRLIEATGFDRQEIVEPGALVRLTMAGLMRGGIVRRRAYGPISNLRHASIGRLFRGREGFLELIESTLWGEPTAVGSKRAACVVHGMGGVGKTRAAVEYAWRNASRYNALLFIEADTPEALDRNLASLSGPLVLDAADESDDQERRLAAALRWLRETAGWLLIVDNVDSREAADAVAALVAKVSGGHVLITSRVRDWAAVVEPLELDVLDIADAVELLLDDTSSRRRHAPDDAERARDVAAAMDSLVLGLVQARAYVSERSTTYAAYLAAFRANDESVKDWFDAAVCQYPRSVATAWQTSVDRLSRRARRVLDVLAWLSPEPIPESFLTGEAPGGTDPPRAVDPLPQLAELASLSLVTRHDDEPPTLSVHRLIQDVGRRRQLRARPSLLARIRRGVRNIGHRRDALDEVIANAPDALLTILMRTTQLLSDLDPRDPAQWAYLSTVMPHLTAAAIAADDLGLPMMRPLNFAAQFLHNTAPSAAEPLYRRALRAAQRVPGQDASHVAGNLATLLKERGTVAEAEALFRELHGEALRCHGEDHPETLSLEEGIAGTLLAAGRIVEAEAAFRRVLAGRQRVLGPEHESTLLSANNLATLLIQHGDLIEAEALLGRSMPVSPMREGLDPRLALVAASNRAQLLRARGDLPAAESLLREVIDNSERLLGIAHHETLTRVNNLAVVLEVRGDDAGAALLLRRAVDGLTRTVGDEDPLTLLTTSNLAGVLSRLGDHATATTLAERALTRLDALLGPDHSSTLKAAYKLAVVLYEGGEIGRATSLSRRAVEGLLASASRSVAEASQARAAMDFHRRCLAKHGRSRTSIKAELGDLLRTHGLSHAALERAARSPTT